MLVKDNWAVNSYTDDTWTDLVVGADSTIATLVLCNTTIDTDVIVGVRLVQTDGTEISVLVSAMVLAQGALPKILDFNSMNVKTGQKLQVKASVAGANFTASGFAEA